MGKWYCFFSAQYLPTMGGVERYTNNLARYLTAKGNRVTVVTSKTGALPEHEVLDGIEIYRLPSYSLMKGRFPVLRPSRQLRKLRQELRPDIVIVQTRFYLLSLWGARWARKIHRPCLVLDHSTGHLTFGPGILNRMGEWYEHGITWQLRRTGAEFRGVSKACNKWLTHFRIQAKAPLYNAIDLPTIDALQQESGQENYRLLCGVHAGETLVAFAGRLVAEKGVLKLIDAVNRLRQEGEKLHLIVVGTGPLEEAVRAKEKEGIHFLGQFAFSQVVALMRQSDVFCLPTEYAEGFPTTVLEAAACRCFTIATNRGGSAELIADDSYGIILPDNEVDRLCAALRLALRDEAYRKSAAEKARQRLEAYFTWDKVSDHLIEITDQRIDSKTEG